jgi:formylglycine-generating enzyme required for sulfatase activity
MTETNLCPHCSSEVPAGTKFCASCGKSLSSAPSAPAPVYPAATPPPAAKSKAWMWVVGVIGLCLICVLLIAGIYAVGNLTGMDLPNPFATKTPTPTNTPTQTPTPTITPTPTLGFGSTRMRIKDGMQEVYIPEGSFMMGDEGGSSSEKPVHRVTLDAFWIDQTEVTNAMYEKCVEAGACSPPSSDDSDIGDSYYGNSQYADYPVIYVNWHSIVAAVMTQRQ